MNTLGISLLWLAGQVTLLCSVSTVIYLIARRRHPGAGATAALSGLLLAAVLTIFVFSPWPRWTLGDQSRFSDQRPSAVENQPLPALDENNLLAGGGTPRQQLDGDQESTHTSAWHAGWSYVAQVFKDVSQWEIPADDRRVGWLTTVLLSAIAMGALRLLAGWLTVQRCIRRSQVIEDGDALKTVNELRAMMSCRHEVELRESREVMSAATVGWRVPIILLPRDWRDWSPSIRRTVIAHELAHVTANDAAKWLAAQLGLLLHFYHPMMHWLMHRLRLEQELAADATAARVTGGSHTYLKTLAELAARQPDRPAAWLAQAFLPTHGTLIRRIEMLRDTRNQRPHSSTLRRGTIIALTLAAFVVAGLRQSTSPVAAQQAAAKKPPAAEKTPAEKLAMRNLSINHVKQLGLAFHNYLAEHGHFPPPVLLGPDGKTEYSWRVALLPYLEELELSKKYDTTQPWDSKHNRTVLEQMPTVFRSPYDDDDSTNASYFVFVGEHTALGNTPGKGIELRDYPDGTSATWLTVEAKRDIPWTKPQDIPYSADAELPKLGGWHDDGFDAGLVDGSARFYADTNDETILRRLITRDDGEVFDPSELKP